MHNLIALIPARGGSKRIPRKNIKQLGGHPLIAYTIEVAKQSGIFDAIYCSTDDLETEAICQHYGCEVIHRPKLFSGDDSPDIEWIQHALSNVPHADYFAILRPTNPFRTVEMLRKAWQGYIKGKWMKAVEPVEQHPMKMWRYSAETGHIVEAIYDVHPARGVLHAFPTQTLPQYYVQNGSLEIRPYEFWINTRLIHIQPYFTKGLEGYDLNTEKDWIYAEWLVVTNRVKLIEIDKEPWRGNV